MANVVTSPRYSRWRRPLTDEFVVIATVPEPDVLTDAPSLVRLPDGTCGAPAPGTGTTGWSPTSSTPGDGLRVVARLRLDGYPTSGWRPSAT